LIEGQEGSGKFAFARTAAAALCCTSPKENGAPCGVCHSCRSIAGGCHIDVTELLPEEDKPISVDQVRNMLKNSYISPVESDWRIFILPQCEKLNKAAQNALLKNIEEPKDNTIYFLLCADRTKILPTVRSRAVILRTQALKESEILRILSSEGLSTEQAKEAALLAQGSLGKARIIAKDEAFHAMRERVLSYFQAIMDGASFSKLCQIFPPHGSSRQEVSSFLSMMKLALRDLILLKTSENLLLNFFTDRRFAQDLSSILSLENAVHLFYDCERLFQANQGNANAFASLADFHLFAKQLTREKE
jgi:DNA polymerase-3 subunit delta'